MRPIWATRFTVSTREGSDPASLHDWLVGAAHRWLASEVAPGDDEPAPWAFVVPADPAPDYRLVGPDGRARIETKHAASGPTRTWRGSVTQPDPAPGAAGAQPVRSEVQIISEWSGPASRSEATSDVTVRRLVGSGAAPAGIDGTAPRAPEVVHEIITTDRARRGDVELRPDAWRVGRSNVPALVATLDRADRQIPVVVVAEALPGVMPVDVMSVNTLPVDAASIARALAGLALVVALDADGASAALVDALGPDRGIGAGAVRVCWSGRSPSDVSGADWTYSPERLAADGLGERLADVLAARLAAIAAGEVGQDRRVWEVEKAVRRETERARAAQRAGQSLDHQLDELVLTAEAEKAAIADHYAALLRDADERGHHLAATIAAQEAAIARLHADVAQIRTQQEGRRASVSTRPTADRIAAIRIIERSLGAGTLASIVDLVADCADPDAISFHDNARLSARGHQFEGSLLSAGRLFCRLCYVAHDYHRGQLVGNFGIAFASLGEQYAPTVSQTARNQHYAQYAFTYDHGDGTGPTEVMAAHHLKIIGSDPPTTLRVYFYVDQVNRRFVVWHVGRHLKGKRDSSG